MRLRANEIGEWLDQWEILTLLSPGGRDAIQPEHRLNRELGECLGWAGVRRSLYTFQLATNKRKFSFRRIASWRPPVNHHND
jgi:hypothetical protein